MNISERFLSPDLPAGFYWFNEPPKASVGNGLEIHTGAQTDFWQTTHYGFQRDDGHCLFTRRNRDFSLTTHVEFRPQSQYDQCGLMARLDARNWIKLSTEYEDPETSRLGSVVTNLGYSDWATQDVSSDQTDMWYRLSRRGRDFLLENSVDGVAWRQMRITHLHQASGPLEIGVYACSPLGQDFWCRFTRLEITDNQWLFQP